MKEASDKSLVVYLSECSAIEVRTLIGFMESSLSRTSKQLAEQYETVENIPRAPSKKRRELAEALVGLLRWYGSDAIAYVARWAFGKEPGVHYHEIVRDVAKQINGNLKKKNRRDLPRVASVNEWEELIVEMLLSGVFKDRTQEETAQMLQEAGLDQDAAVNAARKFGPGLSGVTLPVLVQTLGKKTVTVLLKDILFAVTYKFVGKEAAKKLAQRLIIKFAQRSWAKFISTIGWALVGVDVLLFTTSPATRITVPAVAAISVFRTRAALEGKPRQRKRKKKARKG